MGSVVLVPGAFHGAWCFAEVVRGLAAEGIPAFAADPPDLGADLHDDAAYVRDLLDHLDPPVVLLGHSYGGAIITEAGTHPSVAHLIFLASLVPDERETCGQLLGVAAAGIDDEPKAPPSDPAELFYHDCDEQIVAWAVERLRPRPLTWMRQSPRAVGWRVRPSTYVVCAADRAIPAEVQKSWAARCTASIEWDSSHSPFMSHPKWVVELIATTASHSKTDSAGRDSTARLKGTLA